MGFCKLTGVIFLAVFSSVASQWDKPSGKRYSVSSSSEIKNLQKSLKPGDYMVMRGGVWKDAKFTLTANGTSGVGKAIYLMADKPGGTKLIGQSAITINGRHIEVRDLLFEGSDSTKPTPVTFKSRAFKSRFTNSAILGFNNINRSVKCHWVEIWGVNNTVDYNTFEKKIGIGQLVRVKTNNTKTCKPGDMNDSHGHKIRYNYFGARPDTGEDNGEGVQLGLKECEFGYSDSLVEFNLFQDYDAEIESISVKMARNVIRHNTFLSSGSHITLRHGDENRVEQNYFFCNGKNDCGGIRVFGERHIIINNYIEGEITDDMYRGSLAIQAGRDWLKRSGSNSLIERNVLYNCTQCIMIGLSGLLSNNNNRYNKNVAQGKSSNSMLIEEDVLEKGAIWTQNFINKGRIRKGSRVGVTVQDPGFKYDSKLKIQVPSVVTFSMKYPPLTRDKVGPTWKRS